MAYWLMTSEPETYGWADLVRDRKTEWDGVRNPAAALHGQSEGLIAPDMPTLRLAAAFKD